MAYVKAQRNPVGGSTSSNIVSINLARWNKTKKIIHFNGGSLNALKDAKRRKRTNLKNEMSVWLDPADKKILVDPGGTLFPYKATAKTLEFTSPTFSMMPTGVYTFVGEDDKNNLEYKLEEVDNIN